MCNETFQINFRSPFTIHAKRIYKILADYFNFNSKGDNYENK
jgi:hypothetical protein